MNTKTIAIVVGVIVVLGAGYYFYAQSPLYSDQKMTGTNPLYEGSNTKTNSDGNSNPGNQASPTDTFTGTMQELAARGGSTECTYKISAGGVNSTGTVYTSGGKVRADTASLAQGLTVQSHVISMDGYVYTWTNLTPKGFKTKVTASTGAAGSASASGQASAPNQAYNYDCKAWTADPSFFTLPAGVTFTDSSAYSY